MRNHDEGLGYEEGSEDMQGGVSGSGQVTILEASVGVELQEWRCGIH